MRQREDQMCEIENRLTRRKEKMIHPTKIHLAISNRTGTAQSSPHFLAIVVVHYSLAICKIVPSDLRRRSKEVQKGKEEGGRMRRGDNVHVQMKS
jgi:hypothetical protein